MGTQFPMKCRFGGKACGTFPNAVALRQHYDAAHADEYVPKGSKRRPSAALAVVETKPALPPLGIDDLDGLVLGVLEQLDERAVPLDLLPAVFAWRTATAAFLSAVEARRR